jgi:protein-L-isoaspartate(D-aspartate) O-methyltransferase
MRNPITIRLGMICATILVYCIWTGFIRAEGEQSFFHQRKAMVERQIKARGVSDESVLKAMTAVKRHLFVPESLREDAYRDTPLPIGYEQTISQPYIVAFMTEVLELNETDKLLEIGTGSGYQAAVLAEIVSEVYTIELIEELANPAGKRLQALGYKNVTVKCGDGYKGWPRYAPYDAIIVTAAPPEIPQPLIDQLKIGGKMVIPVGVFFQELYLIEKTKAGTVKKELIPVRFVPMVHPQ